MKVSAAGTAPSSGAADRLARLARIGGTTGRVAVRLGVPGQAGIRARVRASSIKGGSGDSLNATTYGPWLYLYFTK
ncbi:hypothetical protein [Actinacidiphila acidipaludis]|uniref:Uncharacterized protein n=1 Tax=Actinacidiphila acidipaludis TaxID=2873382 RepID=A0ABS7Q5V5_9ACTN|nr:hypothetical protein [Streptomyces acidipaludis]MBY8877382.1 hypothetical protein [Streptomyces acidipaludis]